MFLIGGHYCKTQNIKLMKKIVLALTLFTSGFFAEAQTEKGRFLLGGSSNFSFGTASTKIDSNNPDIVDPGRNIFASLNPRMGFFIIDNLVVGASVPTSFNFSDGDFGDSRSFGLALGPFVRYYLGSGALRPLVEAGTTIGFQNSRFTNNLDETTKTTNNTLSTQAGVGAAYFINDNISIDGLFGFQSDRQKPDNNPDNLVITSNRWGLNVGLTILF